MLKRREERGRDEREREDLLQLISGLVPWRLCSAPNRFRCCCLIPVALNRCQRWKTAVQEGVHRSASEREIKSGSAVHRGAHDSLWRFDWLIRYRPGQPDSCYSPVPPCNLSVQSFVHSRPDLDTTGCTVTQAN